MKTLQSDWSVRGVLKPLIPPLTLSPRQVRGGAAAPEPEEEDSSFSEGSGLLAETIRKVDRSFRARLSQMAGGTEDMGYQYFSEKVRTPLLTGHIVSHNCLTPVVLSLLRSPGQFQE